MRKCTECGKKITGRSDKRFCNDLCRNKHHNKTPKDHKLTKREQFAMAAMQGMIQGTGTAMNLSKEEAELIAGQSLQFADALMNELKKTESND